MTLVINIEYVHCILDTEMITDFQISLMASLVVTCEVHLLANCKFGIINIIHTLQGCCELPLINVKYNIYSSGGIL